MQDYNQKQDLEQSPEREIEVKVPDNTILLTLDDQLECENPETQINSQIKEDEGYTLSIQPFQNCAKRQMWEQKYSQFFKLDVEQEKEKLLLKRKAPRKPLSPYIFFSQEKRKDIKKNQKNLTAKQIMKLVSKYWQEIKDNKNLIEKYEYLSLRDREAYSILRRYYNQVGVQTPQECLENGIAASVSRMSTQRQSIKNIERAEEMPPNASDTQSEVRNTCRDGNEVPEECRKSSFSSMPECKQIGKKRGRKCLSKEEKEARKIQRMKENEPAKIDKDRSKSDNFVIQAPYSPKEDNNRRVEKICSQLTNNFSKSSFDIPSMENLKKDSQPFNKNAPVQIPLTPVDQNLFKDFDYNIKSEPQFETENQAPQQLEQIENQNVPIKYPTLYPDFESDHREYAMRSLSSNDPLTPLMGLEQGQQGNQSYIEQEQELQQDPDNSYNNSEQQRCFFGENQLEYEEEINQQILQNNNKAEFQKQILNNQQLLIHFLDTNKQNQSDMIIPAQTQRFQNQQTAPLMDQLQMSSGSEIITPNQTRQEFDENQLLGDFLKFQNMMLLQQLQQNIVNCQMMVHQRQNNDVVQQQPTQAPEQPTEHGRHVGRPPGSKKVGRPPSRKNKR